MANLGIDTSDDVSSYLSCLAGQGVTFVARYLNPAGSTPVGLTNQEALNISNTQVGSGYMSVVSLYEWGTTNYTVNYFTPAQGTTDAKNAYTRAQQIGMPTGVAPIYFCVDYDASSSDLSAINSYFEAINAYFDTFNPVPYGVGVYGSFLVVSSVYNSGWASYAYQTYAWSNGQQFASNNLYQDQNGLNLCGFTNDGDLSYGDGGGWRI